ncbi:hypothetical protein HYDPIDRAFT_102895, partial [Hydnomerulius pinastri MD-312]
TQNDFIHDWLPWKQEYLSILLELEAQEKRGLPCELCGDLPGSIRCKTCSGAHAWCNSCAVKVHKHLPFHNLEKWQDSCYQKISLMALGYIWYMGHNGDPCPCVPGPAEDWVDVDDEGLPDTEDPFHVPILNTLPVPRLSQLTIVHATGIFVHKISWCQCSNASERKHLQLLRACLFPASVTRPETAFTFEVLEHHRIDNLECKMTAMSFFAKLRRLTDSGNPDSIPDRYRELLRISRLWRYLTNLKRSGMGHDQERPPQPGDLALFCPACPQPSINLPEDWQQKYPGWLAKLRYVVDGNFSAQHMNMKCPEDDVLITDGRGYMVKVDPYSDHILRSVESKEKSSCSNHRAVNAANASRANLRATGIGATACARHGCFVPHCVVDFQKGEQQMNIDYSICQALNYHSSGIKSALLIYDVACQWSIHFKKRVSECTHLSVPEDMEVLPAVGKFHLSAHKLECFTRFSLNFVEGGGHMDGEILETLWASLNKITPSARAMSAAHRQELYDDHMLDSNWKKAVSITKTLLKKYKRALQGLNETQAPFEELGKNLSPEKIAKWTAEEATAAELRGDYLDIYQPKVEKGKTLLSCRYPPSLHLHLAPSMADIRLSLMSSDTTQNSSSGSVNWLISGIKIEDDQDLLRAAVRQLPADATATQKADIQGKRQKLYLRIRKLEEAADTILKGLELGDDWEAAAHIDDTEFVPPDDYVTMVEEEREGEGVEREEVEDEENYVDEDEDGDAAKPSEEMATWMPSCMNPNRLLELGLGHLGEEELQLRTGQANDALARIRIALGQLAVLYRQNLRSTNSVRSGTRAQKAIQDCKAKAMWHARSYQRARKAMEHLGASDKVLETYQLISPSHLTVNKDITEENRFGQGSDRLPWFWRVQGINNDSSDQWMDEFYRISWLKAKARYCRWTEELALVKHEMHWTMLWFEKHQSEWAKRMVTSEEPGHIAYAAKQVLMYKSFAEEARKKFAGKMAIE